jgi:hypothetical protein
MLTIPLLNDGNQLLQINLAQQICLIHIRQARYGVFMDLSASGGLGNVLGVGDPQPMLTGVVCEDRNRLVRDSYFNFVGDLAFIDTQGTDDPDYSGFGTRWFLIYLEPGDPWQDWDIT